MSRAAIAIFHLVILRHPRSGAAWLCNEGRCRGGGVRATLFATSMEFRCPICRKPVSSETSAEFPFCSERCRVQDLANWATEKYVVSEPAAMDDEAAPTRDEESLPEVPFRPTRDESKN
jgi:endogenous inhibitor of DNA gyrase (YacG/DUF329 family)